MINPDILAGHVGTADAVVFAIDDEKYGEELTAASRLENGASLDGRDLQHWMRQMVAPRKVKKKMHWIMGSINSQRHLGHLMKIAY